MKRWLCNCGCHCVHVFIETGLYFTAIWHFLSSVIRLFDHPGIVASFITTAAETERNNCFKNNPTFYFFQFTWGFFVFCFFKFFTFQLTMLSYKHYHEIVQETVLVYTLSSLLELEKYFYVMQIEISKIDFFFGLKL